MFTLPAANVAASFTAPLSVGSGLIPSNLPSLPGTGFSVSGVLDDAKAKAQGQSDVLRNAIVVFR